MLLRTKPKFKALVSGPDAPGAEIISLVAQQALLLQASACKTTSHMDDQLRLELLRAVRRVCHGRVAGARAVRRRLRLKDGAGLREQFARAGVPPVPADT